MAWIFDHSWYEQLRIDPNSLDAEGVPQHVSVVRTVDDAHVCAVQSSEFPQAHLVGFNQELAAFLGAPSLSSNSHTHKPIQVSDQWVDWLTGKTWMDGRPPLSMVYAGHQFGQWAGQLGDGRAMHIGALIAEDNKSYALQLKGAGPTPFSRRGDGFAVLRSSIREYVASEALYHLGIPTTRALALVETGHLVSRDRYYSGMIEQEPGAIVCRVSPGFIRFGHFEWFASQGADDLLRSLADFCVARYFPECTQEEQPYLSLFKTVAERTLDLVAQWQGIGFVHGVMNTDNMSLLSETLDYGPYGFMDQYNPNWTPNTSDRPQGRYRQGQQGQVAIWNLMQLANGLYPLVGKAEGFQDILAWAQDVWPQKESDVFVRKLGLPLGADQDRALVRSLLVWMERAQVDFTDFFRKLSGIDRPEELVEDHWSTSVLDQWMAWWRDYMDRASYWGVSDQQRQQLMKSVNPRFVPRNHHLERVIHAATQGDWHLFHDLMRVLADPMSSELEDPYGWAHPKPKDAPDTALSCSS